MLIAMERVFDEAKETLSDTDFGEVAAEKVLMYLADSKVCLLFWNFNSF